MKKLILVYAIVSIGASQLYGMESEQPSYESLPQEIKQEILKAFLETSKNSGEVINAIKTFSTLNNQYYKLLNNLNLTNFTALMNVLAKKFPDEIRETIAQRFNTPIAKHYLVLGSSFILNVLDSRDSKRALQNAYRLFEKEVDSNFSWKGSIACTHHSLLSQAYSQIVKPHRGPPIKTYNFHEKEILTLLLDRGAKPDTLLIEEAKEIAEQNPTDLNIKLLALLQQAAENK